MMYSNPFFKTSERMRCIEEMVISGEPAADVGTDHGFVPLELLLSGKVPYAVLSDVNRGPLDRAREHAAECGIDTSRYDLRLGSGLEPLKVAEVSTVILAGMGAELMVSILSADMEKTLSYRRFVLQPRTRCPVLCAWLSSQGFVMEQCRLVEENGRICEVMAWRPPVSQVLSSDSCDPFDEELRLLAALAGQQEELFPVYLDRRIKERKDILSGLLLSGSEESKASAGKIQKELDSLIRFTKSK